jgi:rhamnosyltransferase
MLIRDSAEFYSCNCRAFWANGKEQDLCKSFGQRRLDHFFESASQGCTYVFRQRIALVLQDFLKAAEGPLRGVQYHDWLFYAWARTQGHQWAMDEARMVRYRQAAGNVIGANAGLSAARRRVRMLRSGWLREQALSILRSLSLQSTEMHLRLSRFDWRDRLWLAAHAGDCRRRPRDAAMFALMVLTFGI